MHQLGGRPSSFLVGVVLVICAALGPVPMASPGPSLTWRVGALGVRQRGGRVNRLQTPLAAPQGAYMGDRCDGSPTVASNADNLGEIT
jgi:hypothetical protein